MRFFTRPAFIFVKFLVVCAEANVEDTKFRLAQSSSRLLACLDRAEAWQPKLKTRTETLQTYRASLQQLEKFLARADAALMAGRQDGSQEHEVSIVAQNYLNRRGNESGITVVLDLHSKSKFLCLI